MPGVHLRPWRDQDAPAIQAMTDDLHIKRWSSMGTDVQAWIARQRAGTRGPSLAICTTGNDDALGKIAVRLPGPRVAGHQLRRNPTQRSPRR